MSFQAYLDNIKAKTGKSPDDFRKIAEKKGLLKSGVKAMQIVGWLKEDFGLGHGHAMAIYAVLSSLKEKNTTPEESIGRHFTGSKSHWLGVFESLIKKIKGFGDDLNLGTTNTYISILKGTKKFAIVQITGERMDIGVKLKNVEPTKRFESSGSWNVMVTHRVRIIEPKQIDAEVLAWLKRAYNAA